MNNINFGTKITTQIYKNRNGLDKHMNELNHNNLIKDTSTNTKRGILLADDKLSQNGTDDYLVIDASKRKSLEIHVKDIKNMNTPIDYKNRIKISYKALNKMVPEKVAEFFVNGYKNKINN